MANIKYSEEKWSIARAYYESGLLLKDIEWKTKIPIPAISKKAKANEWQKLDQKKMLIANESQVRAEKATLAPLELRVHNELVDERTNDLIYFNKTQKRLANISMTMIEEKLASKELSIGELQGASNVVNTSRQGVLGKEPTTLIQNNIQVKIEDLLSDL